MSVKERQEEHTTSGTDIYERNRYFNGKLMTAPDMLVEQDHHRGRLHHLAHYVSGTGLVRGVTVEELEQDGENLYADVGRGFAIDHLGRLIEVRDGEHDIRPRDEDESDFARQETLYLYLEYDECKRDEVLASELGNGCEDRCEYNRIVDTYQFTYSTAGPAHHKTVLDFDLPDRAELEDDNEEAVLTKLARAYRSALEEDEEATEALDATPLYLGAYSRDGDVWYLDDEESHSPLQYTNDMLYDVLARHVSDYDDPHDVEALRTIEGKGSPSGNVVFGSSNGSVKATTTVGDGDDAEVTVDLEVTGDVDESLGRRIEVLERNVKLLVGCVEELVEVTEKMAEAFENLDVDFEYQPEECRNLGEIDWPDDE